MGSSSYIPPSFPNWPHPLFPHWSPGSTESIRSFRLERVEVGLMCLWLGFGGLGIYGVQGPAFTGFRE